MCGCGVQRTTCTGVSALLPPCELRLSGWAESTFALRVMLLIPAENFYLFVSCHQPCSLKKPIRPNRCGQQQDTDPPRRIFCLGLVATVLLSYLFFKFLYEYECFACIYVYTPRACLCLCRVEKESSYLLELELRTVVSTTQVLGTELASFRGTASSLNSEPPSFYYFIIF